MNKRWATITYHGLEWRVEGYYIPKEKAKPYDGSGEPGYPGSDSDLIDPEITIVQNYKESDNMMDILSLDASDKLISLALEAFDDPDWYQEVG